MFADDPLLNMPIVNRERAERLYSAVLGQEFTATPESLEASIAHLESVVFGVRSALEMREAAAKAGS